MRPLWNVVKSEEELFVEDCIYVEKIIPYWLVVKNEPELEVTDLKL